MIEQNNKIAAYNRIQNLVKTARHELPEDCFLEVHCFNDDEGGICGSELTDFAIDYIRVVLAVPFAASEDEKNIAVEVFRKLVAEADLADCAEFEDYEYNGDGGSWSGYMFEAEIKMAGENVPLDYTSFKEALRNDMASTLSQWAEGYRSFKIEVGEFEVDSFQGFCEGFLCDFDFEEVVENKGIDWLIDSYVDCCSGEIHDAYLEWFEQNA